MQELPIPQNDEQHLRLRRLRDMLLASGTGVILFSVWTAIKAVVLLLVFLPDVVKGLGFADNELTERVILGVSVLYLVVATGIRLYVGLSARAEARGRKRGWLYLVLALFLALDHLTGCVSFFTTNTPYTSEFFISMAVSIAIELTSLALIGFTEYSAISIKRLLKTMQKEA